MRGFAVSKPEAFPQEAGSSEILRQEYLSAFPHANLHLKLFEALQTQGFQGGLPDEL
jgi:hypothetical protein